MSNVDGLTGSILGVVVGLVGAAVGAFVTIKRATSPRGRADWIWCTVVIFLLVASFAIAFAFTPGWYRFLWFLPYGIGLALLVRCGNRRLIFMCSIAALSCFGGCTSQQEFAHDLALAKLEAAQAQDVAAVEKSKEAPFVFRAKYCRRRGPCIQTDGGFAMPAIDSFDVVELIKGDLTAKYFLVRGVIGGSLAYPKKLVEGQVYTLALTPSERTNQQLRANEQHGEPLVYVNGDEIVVKRTEE